MKTVQVKLAQRSYPIYIGTELLTNVALIRPYLSGKRIFIVTHPLLVQYYAVHLKKSLADYDVDIICLPEGEQHKILDTLTAVFDSLIAKKANRQTTLIALGGGMIGDMTGFAAACFQRGVGFIQIPTSLLAQVDASVGGKTAINYAEQKNLLGAFYQPQCVLIDIATLNTLPARDYLSAFAEVIKYACIADKDLFAWLQDNVNKLLDKEIEALTTVVQRCCEIKADIVMQDEYDTQQIRRQLNFGHTFAHGLECLTHYTRYRHGEAVAIGMVMASRISRQLGYITVEDLTALVDLLKCFQLPTELPGIINPEQLGMAMQVDKKSCDSGVSLVLLQSLGQAYSTEPLDQKQLCELIVKSIK